MSSLCASLCTAVGGVLLLLLLLFCWAVLLLTCFLWSQLKPGSLLVSQFGSPLFPLVVVVVVVIVIVSALILCSRLADRASYPICVLTPLAVVVCFSLHASHTFSHTVLR
jgi:hypothetical protein